MVAQANPKADKWLGMSRESIGVAQDQQRRDIEEMKKQRVPFQMIDELSARAATTLAQALPEIPEVKQSPDQMVLEIGTIVNKSGQNDPAFATAMASMRSRLAQNEAVTNSYLLVDRTSDAAKQATTMAAQTAGGNAAVFDDPLQRTASQTATQVYNPRLIYVLGSEFFWADDDGGKDRVLTFKLVMRVSHPQSGKVAYERSFEKVFRWNNDKKKFVPDV
jgi:hypothetical protein